MKIPVGTIVPSRFISPWYDVTDSLRTNGELWRAFIWLRKNTQLVYLGEYPRRIDATRAQRAYIAAHPKASTKRR